MAARSDGSLAALLLAQRLVETGVPALKASEYWSLLGRVDEPAELLRGQAASVVRDAGFDGDLAERVARLIDAATAFAFQLDELEQSGLRVVSSVDDAYPGALVERLGDKAPPMLYVAGDPPLLGRSLLGVVGSRDVAPEGAAVATAAAEAAAQHGLGLVSGGAKGVDRLAMTAALGAGGVAVGVLAESLVRAVRDGDARRAVADEQLCFITPYKPTAGFSVANAMGRNKLIYALSQATLVVAADREEGGTWAGATEALRIGSAPVLVWSGPGGGPGNAALIERGGIAVSDVEEMFPLPAAEQVSEPSQRQLSLDV